MSRFRGSWRKARWPVSRIMLHFLVPYVLILLVSLCVGVLVNKNTLSLLEREVVNNNHAILDQGRRSVDRRLAEISSINQSVSGGVQVLAFQNMDNPFLGRNVMQVLQTRQTLIDYSLTNNFILGYFVLYEKGDVVLGPNLTYRLQDFHEAILRYDDLAIDQWRTLLFDTYHVNHFLPAKPTLYRGAERDLLVGLHSLDTQVSSNGVVMVLVDNMQLRNVLAGLDIKGDGWAYVADRDGNVLTTLMGPSAEHVPTGVERPAIGHSYRKDDMLVTHAVSDYNGWQYVMAQPYASVISKVTQMNRTMLVSFFLLLFAGVLLAGHLAYRNTRPLESLLQSIRGKEIAPTDVRKVYSLIGSTLSSLSRMNEDMLRHAEEQLPILRDSFFRRLLSGEIQSRQELETWMRHVDLDIQGNAFGVVMLHLRGYQDELSAPILEEMALKRLILREALHGAGRDDVHIHDLDQDDIALLIPCQSTERKAWEAAVGSVLRAFDTGLLRENHLILSCYVGDVYASLLDASLSCKEARSLMHFTPPESWNQVVWFWDFPKDLKTYYYPEELELRLSNQIRAGLHKEAAALLAELERENLHERSLSKVTQTMFLYEVLGTLTKVQEQLPLGDRGLRTDIAAVAATLMEGAEPPQRIFADIQQLLLRVASGVDDRKKSHNSTLVADMLKYLDDNYMDANVCLASAARQFHLSEVYLSQFFKEQTGENFSVHLEQIRMQKALALLQTNRYSIKEIAEKTGYNSSNTFCRAFKRIHQVSATQYRETTARQ